MMTETYESHAAEAVEPEASSNSYEAIRDSSPILSERARSAWQLADKMGQRLREEYQRIADDAELVDAAKQERAARAYERNAQRIAEAKQQARQALLRESSIKERQAKPWPTGESKDISNSTERLSLAYSESERLVRIVEKRSNLKTANSERPNPLFNAGDFLRGKFAEGIGIGGVQGSALCAGVLRAAEELGVDEHDVLDPLRTDEQRELLDNARRLAHYSRLVDTSVPQVPRKLLSRSERRRTAAHGLAGGVTDDPMAKGRPRKKTWK
jgi:hypothetical protein